MKDTYKRVLALCGPCPGGVETEIGIIIACVDTFIRCWALTQLAGASGGVRQWLFKSSRIG